MGGVADVAVNDLHTVEGTGRARTGPVDVEPDHPARGRQQSREVQPPSEPAAPVTSARRPPQASVRAALTPR